MHLGAEVAASTTAVAANVCADDTTVTIPGLTSTMEINVSASGDPLSGLIPMAFYSSDGEATVRWCNVTAGSLTPNAVNWNIRVIQ